jgi:hypothetical protein
LSFGSFYLKGATIFGFVKATHPSKATLFKNSSKNGLFVYTLLTIFATLSVPYYCANNITRILCNFSLAPFSL